LAPRRSDARPVSPRRRDTGVAHLTPALLILTLLSLPTAAAEGPASTKAAAFRRDIQPLLTKYCSDCHADGSTKGNVAFDEYPSDDALVSDTDLWFKVLKNVRAGLMPPRQKPQPTDAEKQRLDDWIKYSAFGLDPANPDPGRVTLRRLNRVEYRNTIKDLMGIDYNTTEEFPPDDTGYGFDTIGDVLSVSPLLLEKYMQAAEKIVGKAVPTVAKFVPEATLTGKDFKAADGSNGERVTFYKPAQLAAKFKAPHDGSYKVTATLTVRGDFDFDPGRCNLVFKIDGKEQINQDFSWNNSKAFPFELPQNWTAGEHQFTVEMKPIEPRGQKPLVYNVPQDAAASTDKKTSPVDMMITGVRIEGPLEEKHWKSPKNYDRFFTREEPPAADPDRRQYAKEVLTAFATRAFRRPVDEPTVERLAKIAESVYQQPGKRFEHGIGQAIVAVLSSPRFLYRVEKSVPNSPDEPFSPVDEYALASRLSYFLWSTMPDAELFGLAQRGELRKNLTAQVKRLIDDPRSKNFVENFTGQWVQGRDVDGISIDVRTVLARDSGQEKELERQLEELRKRFAQQQQIAQATPNAPAGAGTGAGASATGAGAAGTGQQQNRSRLLRPTIELNTTLRTAMRQEPELYFENVIREDRSVADLIDSDYTFLNATLAKHYGITGIKGDQMRKVQLPPDSPRGGLLTMGTVLVVTSNPTRTSPVKRGQFILDNILGMSPPSRKPRRA
jgi:hypothetical protein